MKCNNCEGQNTDDATYCVYCGHRLTNPYQSSHGPASDQEPGSISEPLRTYMTQAIISTLCCCLPLGIPAIVYAAQVNAKQAAGDLVGAQRASDQAKFWSTLAFGLGLAWLFFCAVSGMFGDKFLR